MDNKEKEIVNKIRLGSKDAFHHIFKEYYLPLYYYAKKITGSKENAEEVIQNTFLKLWENPESFNVDKALDSYLYKTVHNNCLNLLKHLQTKEKYNNNYKQRIDEANDIYSLFERNSLSILIASELEEKIEASINGLPKQCQKIFRLSRFEGLKNKEIAEKLDISLNTVIKQMSIALTKLRKSLGQYLKCFF
jgi:RNA polymerase sigma-70 factor (ECF subfamily)